MGRKRWLIEDWLFAAGEDVACLRAAKPVRVPHTWNIEKSLEEHVGRGWYRAVISSDSLSSGKRTFLYFHGAYRDADVYVNGCLAARHEGAGYTPFLVEITPYQKENVDTEITVCVDNRFSEHAVPYGRSFDWANDGGLYRSVEVWQTGKTAIEDVRITAAPIIPQTKWRQHGGQAAFGFSAELDGVKEGSALQWALHRGAKDSVTETEETPMISGEFPCADEIYLEPRFLQDIVYWHFDQPKLYTLRLRVVDQNGNVSDEKEIAFGFRELKLSGGAWQLNGETVRLPGMEWMPGSDPEIGAAEGPDDLAKMLRLLKESNSVLTRFHWQQDDWVYDWCDRHGLLVQEEIPFWGKQPEGDPEALWPVIEAQMKEMISAHRHHPSIIAWGVGNELSAHTWPVQRYIRRATALARELDDTRFANYVTNTAWRCPDHDGAGDGDILMINDYIGTWEPNRQQDEAWKELLNAHPGRAFIPSEFGLCEPAFSGGDPERERIFLEKTNYYRQIPNIVGTIYFCLNDYRTHMGEEGQGRFRRRVHGSADWTGEPKPSYYTVQREHAPLTVERTEAGLRFTCRSDIPCYAVMGYVLTDGIETIVIPDLLPGESWLYEGTLDREESRVCRPGGDLVLNINY